MTEKTKEKKLYRLLGGKEINLESLPKKDLEFLVDLFNRAMSDEDYFDLQRLICGKGAYPLNGSPRVTREIHESALYLAAEDIVDRVGIRQGAILPNKNDEKITIEEVIGAASAAKMLGISRAAVIKAAQNGRIRGKKIGRAWALLQSSVKSYQVTPYRVAAGQAAHRH
jgi:hypothetical protein